MMTMTIAPLTTLLLVSIRVGTVLMFAPIEAIQKLPLPTRLLLVFVLSNLIQLTITPATTTDNELSLVLCGLSEICNGLMLLLSLYAAFAVLNIAGQLIDTQLGLNALAVLNPSEHSQEPFTGRLLSMLAVLYFFMVDGHHHLLRGLVVSFNRIPPGELLLLHGFSPILNQCGLMFSLGLMCASPVIFCVILIDLLGTILTRNMPQMNAYFLIIPLKLLFGLTVLGQLLTFINPLLQLGFEHCFNTWTKAMT